MESNWALDRRLDILILGPMGADETPEASTLPVQQAIQSLLAEDAFVELMDRYGIVETNVRVPVGETPGEIVENILRLLDEVDLVVFNLTPKPESPDRANVFYELGLVHALGIPALLVIQEDAARSVPFYARSAMLYTAAVFTPEALADALRLPLRNFLDLDNREGNLLNDRVTQFYGGLPVVDISAAVGLATGYYDNFLSRLITEGGFLAQYPNLIRAVVYVRPSSLESTYEADRQRLRLALEAEGLTLETAKLEPIPQDSKGYLWFDHVQGVVLDVPRTIYPLRRSPRLFSFMERFRGVTGANARRALIQRQAQIESALLERVEVALDYQVRRDGPRVRPTLLRYTTIEGAPALVQRLLAG
ncbi:MAG: hypothetical protein LCH53_03855 [Bacteroidetes bacterium]|nr:hypothetical protein [Bacteroidota bacterium]